MSARMIASFPRGTYLAAAIVSAVICSSGTAWTQPNLKTEHAPIGKVLSVRGTATLEHTAAVVVQASLGSTGATQAKVDDLVYRGDLVQTGADGAMGIIFGDGTSFNISSNARMELNEFVYDPKGSSNSTLFNLEKGTFTFLAGQIAKSGNMKIETPVGTMGIRGTAPHVEILDDGTVRFTTLVEENKKAEQGGSQPAQRPATPSPAERTKADADRAKRELDRKLTICRGC